MADIQHNRANGREVGFGSLHALRFAPLSPQCSHLPIWLEQLGWPDSRQGFWAGQDPLLHWEIGWNYLNRSSGHQLPSPSILNPSSIPSMGKAAIEEVKGAVTQFVELRHFHNAGADARSLKGNGQDLTNMGSGAVGHHHHTV